MGGYSDMSDGSTDRSAKISPSNLGTCLRKTPLVRLKYVFRLVAFAYVGILSFFSMFTLTRPRAVGEYRVLGSWSYHDKYCVVSDYWKTDARLQGDDHVTLVLHATPMYLQYVTQQAASWDGPISVAVFIPTPRTDASNALEAMFQESLQLHLQSIFAYANSLDFAHASGKVGLHFFFERQNLTECPSLHLSPVAFVPRPSDLGDFAPPAELYPINAARNIARNASHTRLFISGDIEQIFVRDAEPRMARLARRVLLQERQKVVLVHRRFEIEPDADTPRNKHDIATLYEEKRAVQFHDKVYPAGHRIPGIRSWLATPETRVPVVARLMNYTNAEWEPQFVGDERVPMHDERFPFRLRSNTHMGTLLCVRGFRFAVISDVFTFHRGIKRNEGRVEARLKSISRHLGYNQLVKQFRNETASQFPEMQGRCPRFVP